jgi:competence protein ComEC
MLADRGIYGRLTLHSRDNWSLISHAQGWSRLSAFSQRVSDAAAASLRLGMKHEPARAALLETLLLGRWNPDLQEIDESFRRVGLAHILSISGAHLTILLGLVWIIARMIWSNPRYAAALALVVLAWYLLVVPPQVPLWRAAVMSGVFCLGFASGRRVRGVDLLALAAIVVLIWRPVDVFNPGAQLSFLGVASLLLFARPFSLKIWSEPLVRVKSDRWRVGLMRFGADFVSSNVVAASLSVPLVAYHFSLVSPLGVLLSILALPVVTLVLGVGFFKMMVGLVLPSVGVLLAGPLEWLADTTISLVQHGATWPGAYVELAPPPSLVWTLAATLVVLACFAGWFMGRRWAMGAALAVCVAWLAWPGAPASASAWIWPRQSQPAASLHMFYVGDGSCFLLTCANPDDPRDTHTLMFDCGSQEYLDVGRRSIAPAARQLGVTRIDTLMISHADLDHYGGVLDVMDQVPVSRVLVPPQFLAEAEAHPDAAAAALVTGVRERGVPIEAVSRGWKERGGGADFELLWPSPELDAPRANDTSLVLSVRTAGKRVLLNGDIQETPTRDLLASGVDLRADVTDLPHHGSFVESSPRWLAAVRPRIVMQSSGEARLLHDRWRGVIGEDTARLISRRLGTVTVTIGPDGRVSWRSFRKEER